jgi:transcriptional regulator with XRE-family HTH domain
LKSREQILQEFRTTRRKLKVSQKELARRVGVGQSYISELERGRKLGSPYLWSKLIWHLDDHVDERGMDDLTTTDTQERWVLHLAPSEPTLVCRFLNSFAEQLNLRFYCPVCKKPRPFKCYVTDSSFKVNPLDGPHVLPDDRVLQLTCAKCLEYELPTCGGYKVSWDGPIKIQRMLAVTWHPVARVSNISAEWFDQEAAIVK